MCYLHVLMMNRTKSLTAAVAIVATSMMLTAFAPSATAAGDDSAASSSATVSSSRSFKAVQPKSDLLKESTSTTNDGGWGTQTLDVPQTKSQAEKDAEAARAAAEAAAAQAAQAAAASRSTDRESLPASGTQSFAVAPPNGASAASVLSFANQFVGKVPYVYGGSTTAGWDCSGFVQYVFASVGISLPRASGAQATVGTAVPDLSQAMPGDIIANGGHAGIYIGNGMVVNALNPSQGTAVSSVGVSFSGGYSIRRVL
ncbi:NlpC/P60 family protein [Bifidobacterium subtile]|jgi:cell wall-associated NlpC family hydrolase|uniref:NlpC/P60 family protein n=2 Tax=Bifidobacterium subtile TaxID=77635 RepID=A0A087E3S9_9BIFI|nr:NlpC/P60 family protein [Bifidobacterium subtile]